jgi:hypothetical protein
MAGPVLYTGATGNLLDRIGNLIRDVLGFYGEVEDGLGWVGKHSGAQSLWEDCRQHGRPVGQLVIGWGGNVPPLPLMHGEGAWPPAEAELQQA